MDDLANMLNNAYKKFLDTAIERLRNCGYDYSEIGVFGSYARGTFTGRSDIDILILVDHNPTYIELNNFRMLFMDMPVIEITLRNKTFLEAEDRFAVQVKEDYERLL